MNGVVEVPIIPKESRSKGVKQGHFRDNHTEHVKNLKFCAHCNRKTHNTVDCFQLHPERLAELKARKAQPKPNCTSIIPI
jgi:hypothetical protein